MKNRQKVNRRGPHPNQKRITEIEQQIVQLSWQRKQNDRLIRRGLESTKSLKQKDAIIHLSQNNTMENLRWQQAVIKDELTRPLVLTDQQMSQVLRDERVAKERLQKYYETHLAASVKLQDVVLRRPDPDSPDNRARLVGLAQVEDRVKKGLQNLHNEKPTIHNRFSGLFGDEETGRGPIHGRLFDKFFH